MDLQLDPHPGGKALFLASFVLLLTALLFLGPSVEAQNEISKSRKETYAQALDLEVGRHDPRAAIPVYEGLLEEEDPVTPRALLRLGMCFDKTGRSREARDAFREVLRRYPKSRRLCDEARQELASFPGRDQKEFSLDAADTSRPTILGTGRRGIPQEVSPISRRDEPTLLVKPHLTPIVQTLFLHRLIGERRIESALREMAQSKNLEGSSPQSVRSQIFARRSELQQNLEEGFSERRRQIEERLAAAGHGPLEIERLLRQVQESIQPCLVADFPFRGLLMGRALAESRFRQRLQREFESKKKAGRSESEIARRLRQLMDRFYRGQEGECRYRRNARRLELKDRGHPPLEIRQALETLDRAWTTLGFDGQNSLALVESVLSEFAWKSPKPSKKETVRREGAEDLHERVQRLSRALSTRDKRIRELERALREAKEKLAKD